MRKKGFEMTLVSFVIPCYRSEKTIACVVKEIDDAMSRLQQYRHEIVLVNDCSPDNTYKVLRALAQSNGHIAVVDLAKNFVLSPGRSETAD